MLQIEEESIILTKKLELCSETCSRVMNKFKDLGNTPIKNRLIVFISENHKIIKDTLKKSLKYYNISLDYKVIPIDMYDMNDIDNTGKQIIITANNLLSINKLYDFNQEFIAIDFLTKSHLNNSIFYINSMIRNIKKYNNFTISNIQGKV